MLTPGCNTKNKGSDNKYIISEKHLRELANHRNPQLLEGAGIFDWLKGKARKWMGVSEKVQRPSKANETNPNNKKEQPSKPKPEPKSEPKKQKRVYEPDDTDLPPARSWPLVVGGYPNTLPEWHKAWKKLSEFDGATGYRDAFFSAFRVFMNERGKTYNDYDREVNKML
jgi:hypothetical protein